MKPCLFCIIACAVWGLCLSSCILSPPLVPEEPGPPAAAEPLPATVTVEAISIPAEAPRGNGTPPDACDSITFLRFRPETQTGDPKPVRAVLLMIPGYLGGANNFYSFGRHLVALAEQAGEGSVEVWAFERRPNCLEDLTGMNAAEQLGDPDVALDYYYNGRTINGSAFAGFLQSGEAPYLSEFGLQLVMEDIYRIAVHMMPDREDRARCLFVGGHSLGAYLSALFAGWDFDNNTETTADAGFKNCAGLIGLDRPLETIAGSIEESQYVLELAALRQGTAGRLDVLPGISFPPEALAIPEMLGLYAARFPDNESGFFQKAAVSSETEALVRLFQSQSIAGYFAGPDNFYERRFTNEAMLGIFLDDNFQPVTIGRMSMGFLAGGPVARRRFPGQLLEELRLNTLFDAENIFVACGDNESLYRWANFDTVGTSADPLYQDCSGMVTLTTVNEEVTDIQEAAAAMYAGPLNFFEWYFPARLRLDIEAAGADYSKSYGLWLCYADALDGVPKYELLEEDVEGYDHLDFLLAAADRPQRRENEVLKPLLEFVLSLSDGTVTVP